MVQSMKNDIGEIVCVIERLDELAYNTYKPIVENICIRKSIGIGSGTFVGLYGRNM